MVRKFKKKTLFFAGIVGLSLLSLFGIRNTSESNILSEQDLKDLLTSTPIARADVLIAPAPGPYWPDPCPSGPCPAPAGPGGPMGFDDDSRGGYVV